MQASLCSQHTWTACSASDSLSNRTTPQPLGCRLTPSRMSALTPPKGLNRSLRSCQAYSKGSPCTITCDTARIFSTSQQQAFVDSHRASDNVFMCVFILMLSSFLAAETQQTNSTSMLDTAASGRNRCRRNRRTVSMWFLTPVWNRTSQEQPASSLI